MQTAEQFWPIWAQGTSNPGSPTVSKSCMFEFATAFAAHELAALAREHDTMQEIIGERDAELAAARTKIEQQAYLLQLIVMAVCDPREAVKGNLPTQAKAVEMIIDQALGSQREPGESK